MTRAAIEIRDDRLAELCRRHHIRRLSLFGSVLTEAFGDGSDVDVLVEFEPGHTPGFALIRIEDEISSLLGGRKIDLVIEKALNRRLRKSVLESAEVRYAAEG
jgi:uncharacterized protein